MACLLRRSVLALAIPLLLTLSFPSSTYAESKRALRLVASPYDLIDAVTAVRASYGRAPYAISPILMLTAQDHADYMAATGNASHTGAGGSSVTDRLLAAGYPLDGDLSLGGFRSENITSGAENMSVQAAVDHWTKDTLHLTTMISASLTEIGAGISVNNGRAYFVIDCARPTNSGAPQAFGTSVIGGSTLSASGAVIIPVVVSTPNPDGDIIHEVRAGQTLWQIAISYDTKIDEIKRLNNLYDDNIYPGTKLLIKKNVPLASTLTPSAPTEVAVLTATNLSTVIRSVPTPTLSVHPARNTLPVPRENLMGVVIAMLAVAILAGGIVAWIGTTKK